tara:strand:+ start:4209 stop:4658 length:450 start_codon:yes stop_codon:yes gene_type:complete
MNTTNLNPYEILVQSAAFRKVDPVEFEYRHEKLCSKKYEDLGEYEELLASDFLDHLVDTLTSGDMWKFNPTCIKVFVENSKFEFDRKKLEEFVLEHGDITVKDIDRNVSLYSVSCRIEMLAINILGLDPKILNDSEYVCVQTLTGNIKL